MIHPACQKTGRHNWDWWEHKFSDENGRKIGSLPDGSPATSSKSPKFYYRRECQNMGCDAVEVAEALSSSGEHMIVDPGGSEVLYGLPPKPIA